MSDNKHFPRIILAGVLALGVGAAWAGWHNATDTQGIAPLLDDDAVAALQLNPAQQAALQQVRSQSGLVLQTVRSELGGLRQRLDDELSKDTPDLRQIFEQGTAERRQLIFASIDQARELRLSFYDSLSPAQKRLVAERIGQRLSRIDRLRTVLGRLLLNQS